MVYPRVVEASFIFNLGVLLVYSGACLLAVDRSQRRLKRVEREHEAVDRELRRVRAELERLEIEERMRHDERTT